MKRLREKAIRLLALAVTIGALSISWHVKEIRQTFLTKLLAKNKMQSFVSITQDSTVTWSSNSPLQSSFAPNPQDFAYCSKTNYLPDQGTAFEQNENNTRPFSIHASDFLPHHKNTCSSVHDAINAIRYGTRQWEKKYQNLSLLERECLHSDFVPHGCDVPLYSPRQMCNVLNRFSHVIIQGDSLSRHLQGGLLMGLRNDLIRGGLVPSPSSTPNPSSNYSKCLCDAQFSEHIACRKHDSLYNRFHPHQLGLCPELAVEDQFESVFNINRLHKGVYKFNGVNCTSGKGILIMAQGGIHLRNQASATYQQILKKFFADPIFRSCAEQGKAYLMWTSYQAQSPSYDEKYPAQSINFGLPFNAAMKKLIRQDKIQNLTIMDWLNFTIGAQHTDGLHFAAQANYFKAQHFVAVADLMWKERMTVSY